MAVIVEHFGVHRNHLIVDGLKDQAFVKCLRKRAAGPVDSWLQS